MERPNILYFVCHDLGKHAGCYGAPVFTPHLDAFAREGLTFHQAYCNSPACTPSRICAMTGQYAHVSGGIGLAHMGWPLSHDVPTIVDHLNKHSSYETIHAGMEHERHPGENHYAVELQESWEDFNTHVAVDKALDYLRRRERSRPFYLNIGSQQPHASTWQKADDLHGGAVPEEDVYIPPFMPNASQTRQRFAKFQAAIRYMDSHFGRLLQGLKEMGHDRDTLIIFTTDHGIAGERAKGTLYDRGTEISLIVRLPEAELPARHCHHLIQNIDFLPTLLETAGVTYSAPLPGKSFLPLLLGRENYLPHEAIFTERNFHGEERVWEGKGDFIDRYDPMRSVRTGEFHYIRNYDPTIKRQPWLPPELDEPLDTVPIPVRLRPEEELYHVRHDPLEFINVAERPEFRHVLADLSGRLDQWMRETDDFVLRDEVPQRREKPGWGKWT